ncbi:MAG: hypothetical protein JXA37_10345 [Chloroflexia bacterium]|nr:hypothetical protein [Chloroflexia bacterium]
MPLSTDAPTLDLRLHLGCGLVHRPGWVNLDRYQTAAADVQAGALLLPFADGAAVEIAACQLVEHLGYVGTLYALSEWARVLAPGGRLCVETPDRGATLRAAADEAGREQALPWLFGAAGRGQGHRYLFGAAELCGLLEQAGLSVLQVRRLCPTPYRPILQIEACRAGDTPASHFRRALRRRLLLDGLLDPADAPPYLSILETVVERAAAALGDSGTGHETLLQLFSLAARYSPRLAAGLLRALPDPAAWPAQALERAGRLLHELEREGWTARLACRWRTRTKFPGAVEAAWAGLEREISLYLAARLYPGRGLEAARAAFEAATAAPSPEDRSLALFCRPALADLARRLAARGVRAFAQGDLAAAARALEAAQGYDPGAHWPRWNLARLYLAQDRSLDALGQYEALQEGLPAGLRPALEREMDAVTGRTGGRDALAVPLAGLEGLL